MSNENTTKIVKEKMDLYVQKLIGELQQGHSESFREYLKVVSKFHNYSFGNQMLIACQMPEATRVAGFQTWKKLGRYVKEGSKSIKVLAPTKRKKVVKKDGKEEEQEYLWFRAVSVFDISQTEGKELPQWSTALGEDNLNIYGRLKAHMIQEGISVEEATLPGGCLGVSYGGRVEIETSLDPMNKALTLIHEYAHEILHKGSENKTLSRGYKECQAEATTYIVANWFGLESPFTKDYLLNWGNKEEELKENLTAVIKASQMIIKILSDEKGTVEEETVSEETMAA